MGNKAFSDPSGDAGEGSCFTVVFLCWSLLSYFCAEFTEIMCKNGIQLLHSLPYHPNSNGVAERTVRTFKDQIKNLGTSQARLFLGRELRNRLDLLKPTSVTDHKEKSKPTVGPRKYNVGDAVLVRDYANPDRPVWVQGVILLRLTSVTDHKEKSKPTEGPRKYNLGDAVLVRDYANHDRPVWVQGVILKCVTSIIYLVKVNNYVWKHHIDQMQDCTIKGLPVDIDRGVTKAQNDYELIRQQWRRSVQDSRSYKGADTG
ncbi:hypothetical protein QYM36_000720 [Artemia franciscana]|uniref:Integrase catalytic domain-containing protein n=1 Tax=Artemia franciscana TaxID=6661 RepID=A0AA88LLC2_ARTSF|nr:hypothetical protein QYM36_000720 [Artemia franciscana]